MSGGTKNGTRNGNVSLAETTTANAVATGTVIITRTAS